MVTANASAADLHRPPKDPLAREGYQVAVTSCVACHIVSQEQTFQPLQSDRAASFEQIANRPNVTLKSLTESMNACTGASLRFLPRCAPISSVSDAERAQVAAYILSLRSPSKPSY
jgi:hypothetical protein